MKDKIHYKRGRKKNVSDGRQERRKNGEIERR
jgi:hypothetical protein